MDGDNWEQVALNGPDAAMPDPAPHDVTGRDPLAAAAAAWLLLSRHREWQGEVRVALEDRRGTAQSVQVLDVTMADDWATLCDAVLVRRTTTSPLPEAFETVLLLHEGGARPSLADWRARTTLVCTLACRAGQLEACLHFDRRRHCRDEILRLGRYFLRLNRASSAGLAPDENPLIEPAERRRALFDWNDTDTDLPFEQCLHQLFEQQARATPQSSAVIGEGVELSYAELNHRADRLAAHLRTLGVGPASLVPVLAERSLAMVVGIIAVLKAGGAYVPLEPGLPAPQRALILAEVGSAIVLAQARFATILAGVSTRVVDLDRPPPECGPAAATALPQPMDLACVMYTSGSTGRPKGTLIEHRSLVNNILWLQRHWPMGAQDRMLQKTPFGFDVSIKEFFWPLACGAALVLAEPCRHVDMAYLSRLIQQQRITVTHFVPSLLQKFLELPQAMACDSLRLVMCGAEVLSPRLRQRFVETLDATLLHLYGPTEAAISVTGLVCDRAPESASVVPLGRPMANVQLYLCDARGELVPPGIPGEILIGGVAVARGYLKQAALTAERFVPDRFRPERGGRLYRSGDLARYRDDGVIEFIGRADQQVKIRGVRVEPREVELLLQGHPDITRAVVLPRADSCGELRFVAYLVCAPGASVEAWALHNYCAQRLPGAAVPTVFRSVDDLPLLPNGKVDRQGLTDHDSNSRPRRSAGPAEHLLLRGDQGGASVEVPRWFAASYDSFMERLADPRYPCYLGAAAARRGALYFSFADSASMAQLPQSLDNFLCLAEARPRERSNLAVFFPPDEPAASHAEYGRRFWSLLDFLHAHDRRAWPKGAPQDPADPCWEFSFGGHQIFCFCAAPSYQRRRSRNLGPGLIVLMQPRQAFFGLDRGTESGEAARRVTRERLRTWDGMEAHPELTAFGEPGNLEWKQYVLPDDTAPQSGACPFRNTSGAFPGVLHNAEGSADGLGVWQ